MLCSFGTFAVSNSDISSLMKRKKQQIEFEVHPSLVSCDFRAAYVREVQGDFAWQIAKTQNVKIRFGHRAESH